MAIGLIKLLNRPGPAGRLYITLWPLAASCAIKYSPFAIAACVVAFSRISKSVRESAVVFDRGRLLSAARLLVPIAAPGIAASFLLVFWLTLGELGLSVLLVPPGESTLSVRVFTLLHYGASEIVSAVSLIIIGLAFLPVVAGAIALKLLTRRPRRQNAAYHLGAQRRAPHPL